MIPKLFKSPSITSLFYWQRHKLFILYSESDINITLILFPLFTRDVGGG